MTAVIVLLAVVAVELSLLVGLLVCLVFLRGGSSGVRPSGAGAFPPVPARTSERDDKRAEDADRRQQEAINNILSYDLTAARKAVRRDAAEDE